MKMQIADYEVRPGVVPSGRKTFVRIIPRGKHARFDDRIHDQPKGSPFRFDPEIFEPDETAEYRIYFLPMQQTMEPAPLTVCDSVLVRPDRDGSLAFEYAFSGEQEYRLVITDPQKDGKELLRLSVFSLFPDLYGRRVYRGDLHVHSYFSDGREEPMIVAANYRKQGFDFMALTDHNKMYPSKLLLEACQNIPSDLTLFTGEEVHVPYPAYIHAINFGGASSVNEFYEEHRAECDGEIARMAQDLKAPDGLDPLQLAQRIWVAQQIKKTGGMSILVHPHWISNAYNMPDDVTDYLFEHEIYDAFELLGGQSVHENNMQTAFYHDQRARGRRIPIVGSSDSHGTEPPVYFTWSSTLVFASDKSFERLTGAIKDLYSVAVEKYPNEEYRVHGPYRYVKYARYLLESYFPRYDELCWEQGRLMKEYACGDKEALDMLRLLSGRAEKFAASFFGG
ncbi:MAG: hypothetical protein HFH93_09605 [Lachnospiraceae bacterium]|nr:hypothetical protein [Lachnospiraceae bacterium]